MFSRRAGTRFNRGRVAVGTSAPGGGGPPPDTDPPEFTWAVEADGASIVGTADEACQTDAGHTPAAGAFSLAGTLATIASTSWDDSTHFRLTFASGSRATDFETVTVSYTAGAEPIEDAAGNALGNLVNTAVTNNSEFLQGAVLIMNMYRATSYVLSGATCTSIVNEVTGSSHNTAGSPQYSATALNGRPALDFNGTTQTISGTDAAVLATLPGQAAHHFFAVAQTDNDDAGQAMFSVGNAGSNNGRRSLGFSPTVNGAHRDVSNNDAGVQTQVLGSDGTPDTSPHVYEWFGSTTTTHRRDGGSPDVNAEAWAPGGTTTPTEWTIAAQRAAAGFGNFFDGDIAYMVVFPSVLAAGTNSPANVRAYLYFLSGLTGS